MAEAFDIPDDDNQLVGWVRGLKSPDQRRMAHALSELFPEEWGFRLTDQGRELMRRALAEALQLGRNQVGPEHVFLAMLSEALKPSTGRVSIPAAVLRLLGPLVIRKEIIQRLVGAHDHHHLVDEPSTHVSGSGTVTCVGGILHWVSDGWDGKS